MQQTTERWEIHIWLWGHLKGKSDLEEQDTDGRMVLKWI
jgi:hypothetical protein